MSDIWKKMGERAFGGTSTAKRRISPTGGSVPKKPASNGLFQDQNQAAATVTSPAENNSSQPAEQTTSTGPRIPTIFLDPVSDWQAHAAKMTELTGGDLTATFRGNNYRLRTSTVAGFRALQRYLYTAKLPFFTFDFKSGRTLKVVVSGLPDLTEEELHDELTAKHFAVENVVRLRTSRGVTRSWLVTLCPDCEREDDETLPAGDIYKLTSLCYVRVRITPYRKPAGPPQCYRCQGFGHGSANCGRPLKCVRCGGPHARRNCSRPPEEKGICCNCEGPHNASYRGCKAYKQAVQAAKPAAKRRPQPATGSRTAPEKAPRTAPDSEDQVEEANNEDTEDGFTTVRRKHRKPRNPANRHPRHRTPPRSRAEQPAKKPRTTPRQRLDWPPKAVPTPPEPAKEPASATPRQPASETPSENQLNNIVGQLAELLQHLTALTGKLTALAETISAELQINRA